MTPSSVEELSDVVASCNRSGERIAIEGGNTLAGMGVPVRAPYARLRTASLTAVVEDAPTDLVVAAQGGITLRNLATQLAAHGTHIPFDAPLAHQATLGGTLAAGWLGPRRHLYGRPRDYVIGSVAVLADGTIARAGGMVVKNVSGYDMSRLYVGAFGTLGIIAQANMKTTALPPHARIFIAPLPEGTRRRALASVVSLRIAPAAAFWVEGFHQSIDGEDGHEGRLIVLLEGSAALLERSTRDLRSALGRAGVPETQILDTGAREAFGRIVDAYVSCLGERSVTYRISAHGQSLVDRVLAARLLADRFELRADTLADAMNDDIILRVSDLDSHALGAKIAMFDDAFHDDEPGATVVAGAHPQRASLNVWGELPDAFDRMRALKARFDPNGTLNPGRFIGGI